MIQNKTSQKASNPFDAGDKDKAWKDFLKNSKPISKAEAIQKMKEASEFQKKSTRSPLD
jgi:hypothetical protein